MRPFQVQGEQKLVDLPVPSALVLFENQIIDGYMYGYSDNYMKIKSEYNIDLKNTFKKVKIEKIEYNELTGATGSLILNGLGEENNIQVHDNA